MRIVFGTAALAACALLGCSFAANRADAAGFDGSKDFLCAPSDVAECDAAARCERVSPSEVDLPPFVRISVSKKQLSSIDGPPRTTAIENVRSVDGHTILQGAENGRAWSLVVNQQTGKLSGSIADGTGAFVVFGACTLR